MLDLMGVDIDNTYCSLQPVKDSLTVYKVPDRVQGLVLHCREWSFKGASGVFCDEDGSSFYYDNGVDAYIYDFVVEIQCREAKKMAFLDFDGHVYKYRHTVSLTATKHSIIKTVNGRENNAFIKTEDIWNTDPLIINIESDGFISMFGTDIKNIKVDFPINNNLEFHSAMVAAYRQLIAKGKNKTIFCK